MKITVKQYARSLYELVEGKDKAEVKSVIANFIDLLVKNRDLNKSDEILNELEKFWSAADGELKAEITCARELGKEAKKLVVEYLKDKTKSEKIVLEEKIDKKKIVKKIIYTHPLFDVEVVKAQKELPKLNKNDPIYFCGSYFRYGFHEDALMSSVELCNKLIREKVL